MAATRSPSAEPRRETLTMHGHDYAYRVAGSGPALLLVHGIAGDAENWREVIEPLARRHTVIVPDLPGHGYSAHGGGDFSLGAMATALRDLLVAIGVERVTLAGHSLGGGVAMQFSYQFPERCERLVLVSSGGLGPEVSPILRAAALPGSELFIGVTAEAVGWARSTLGRGLAAVGVRPSADIEEVARGYATLADAGRRTAFLSTLRAVVDTRGQRVDARVRLHLARALPVLILWGAKDSIIPIAHGREAHEAIPGSRFEVFEDSGHMPMLEQPERFVGALEAFIEHTDPPEWDAARWRELVLGEAAA